MDKVKDKVLVTPRRHSVLDRHNSLWFDVHRVDTVHMLTLDFSGFAKRQSKLCVVNFSCY